MTESILPLVQSFRPAAGSCSAPALTRCRVSGLSIDTFDCLREDFPEWRMSEGTERGCMALISGEHTPPGAFTTAMRPPEQAQGYALRIAPEGVRIDARDEAGLWYGLQTLRVLLDAGELPAGEIADWPAIPRRGIHLDLKGYQPKLDRLLETARLLSRYKINTILLEIEDKFAFQAAPGVGVPEAYTATQLREFGRFCKARHIQVIPKLQCLGHVDYLLGLEEYRALREDDHPYQYCPRNPEGFRLWAALAEELIEALPGHDFFHIGADEAMYLGQCPVCSQHRRADTFMHRVLQCIDFVRAHGKTPIMWEDILRNLHGHLNEEEVQHTWQLGREAVLMYWVYGYGGRGNEFPFLPRYQEKGLRVWGASGLSGCGPSWVQNVPPLTERAPNISAWTKAAKEAKLEGVVTTAWTKIASADPPAEPIDACWFTMLYAAESMWSGRERALDDFSRAAYRALFGADTPDGLVRYLAEMASGLLPSDDQLPCTRNEPLLRLFLAAARHADHERARADLLDALTMYHGKLGACLADYRQNMIQGRADNFRRSLESHAAAYREALEALYEPSTVEGVMQSRYGRDFKLLEEIDGLLAETAKI